MTTRRPLLTRIFFFLAALILSPFSHASALEQIEANGVRFYYPKGEEEIVLSLKAQTPKLLSFLSSRGLPVRTPLHVVLDGEYDLPEAVSDMIPHREIRIPLKAPGVLEDGYLEPDPWAYFYFKGLCMQGMSSLRAGIPAAAHRVFGEAASPNMILPPWLTEGVCRILYSSCTGSPLLDPYNEALFHTQLPEDLSRVSNHPGAWPGYHASRIYGIPFMAWVHSHYGWSKILEFLALHGRGVVPIEIDIKARKAFGKSWSELWTEFRNEAAFPQQAIAGMTIDGYWAEPFIYWNASGLYPGRKTVSPRGRYGYVSGNNALWLSEYSPEGISRMIGYRRGIVMNPGVSHIWDPAPGGVAVSRKGSRPCLMLFDLDDTPPGSRMRTRQVIDAPSGIVQFSGPEVSPSGRIAVSANSGGNWDIWVFDAGWERITAHPGIDMDPWWVGEELVFSSSMSGTFQIHDRSLNQLTRTELGAVLPRQGSCMNLMPSGWAVEKLEALSGKTVTMEQIAAQMSSPEGSAVEARALKSPAGRSGEEPWEMPTGVGSDSRSYSPWQSLYPNFMAPDLYMGPSDTQAGLVTWGRDVSGDYSVRAGFRYSFNLDYLSLQASMLIRDVGLSFTRYPLSYDPEKTVETEESRNEMHLSFNPPKLKWLTLSVGRLDFEPLGDPGPGDEEVWGGLSVVIPASSLSTGLTFESFSGGRRSVFGSSRFVYGTDIVLAAQVQAGKSWGETTPGHGTFRVGGNVGEGYFTSRASRLFPLRGFRANILEADKALTASIETYFPLADLQMGHKTLPLFFHRLSLGTFVDAGFCSEKITKDQLMAGIGFELITSMEIAWGNFSAFKVGVAWPVSQPDDLDEKGPVLVLQIGRPL